MQERQHTLDELNNMEKVSRYLLDSGTVDSAAFEDYLSEL